MSTRTKFATVQEGRWAVRNSLSAAWKQAKTTVAKRDQSCYSYGTRTFACDAVKDAFGETRQVREVLRGLTGLPQDEQVARLEKARGIIEDAKKLLTLAKTQDPENAATYVELRDGPLHEAKLAATATRVLAKDRDFEAHQEAKKAKSYGSSYSDDC